MRLQGETEWERYIHCEDKREKWPLEWGGIFNEYSYKLEVSVKNRVHALLSSAHYVRSYRTYIPLFQQDTNIITSAYALY